MEPVTVTIVLSVEPLRLTPPPDASTYALIDSEVARVVALAPLIVSLSRIAVPDTPVFITGLVSVLLVKVCVAARPTTVSLAESGIVQVLSADGSAAIRVVSYPLSVEPSKITPFEVLISSTLTVVVVPVTVRSPVTVRLSATVTSEVALPIVIAIPLLYVASFKAPLELVIYAFVSS